MLEQFCLFYNCFAAFGANHICHASVVRMSESEANVSRVEIFRQRCQHLYFGEYRFLFERFRRPCRRLGWWNLEIFDLETSSHLAANQTYLRPMPFQQGICLIDTSDTMRKLERAESSGLARNQGNVSKVVKIHEMEEDGTTRRGIVFVELIRCAVQRHHSLTTNDMSCTALGVLLDKRVRGLTVSVVSGQLTHCTRCFMGRGGVSQLVVSQTYHDRVRVPFDPESSIDHA